MIKAVFDTNTYISGIFWRGAPRKAIELARSRTVELYISEDILLELEGVLKRKFGVGGEMVKTITTNILATARLVEVKRDIDTVKADPSDNKVLACALECGARYLVSGDRHLLELERYSGIQILKASRFIKVIEKEGRG